MNQSIEIELKFNRKDFEEVYFNGNQLNYFKSTTTKRPFQNLLIYSLLFSVLLYNVIFENSTHIMTIIMGLIFLTNLIIYLIKVYGIRGKRKKVKDYLDGVEKIKNHKLILTKNSFTIIQENEKFIEKWTDFKPIEINEMFVYLMSDKENYLIPKKSMTELEYTTLTSILTEKIK
ncbi:hypothetical protein AAT17_00280 [Nonlabens sp. MIC269]|nr:hypothetical protein AAT17_00280 [Nonlabens sp. MIC269]